MRLRLPRPLLTAAALFVCAIPVGAAAQQLPVNPQQAQQLLQNPEIARQLQQRLQGSGLTPDQVRSRLRGSGYSESMLDDYLGGTGASGRRSGAGSNLTNEQMIQAMELLGLAEQEELDQFRTANDSLGGMLGDSTSRGARRRQGPLRTGARDFLLDTMAVDSLRLFDPARLPDSSRLSPADSIRRRLGAGAYERDSLARDRRARELRAQRDSGLAIFGMDLFANGTSLFDANQAGAVDRNYKLGPGDRLLLVLTGDVEQAYPLTVTREGFVLIPQVGQLYVGNLSLAQFDELLYSRLGRVYSGVRRNGGSTRFSVSVVQFRSSQVFVAGDVLEPGSYRVSSAGTALTALYAAGGPSDAGSLRRIEVRRGGRVVGTLDVYDYLIRGDASQDVRLESGDVLFVPPRLARVRALGEVLRPATYELKPGETLADLMRAAGGLTALASPRQITIERVVPPGQRAEAGRDRQVLAVAAESGAPAVPLVNGDVVRVSRIAERVRNRLTVVGNVYAPGPLGFRDGMRLSEALRAAGGLKPDTYLGRVLVARLQPDSTRTQLRAILRDTTGALFEDLALREDDEIQVFSTTSFRPERYVAIAGAVRKGGRFRYREGMTLRDLTLLAGGLDEGALLTEAEIARLPETRVNGVTARTVRVGLDSSYVPERGAAGGDVNGPPGIPAPASGAPEVALRPYDQVLILRQPDFALQRTVFLGGEVRYPGRYALRTKTERLSEVIARAGGTSAEADPNGVQFFRMLQRQGQLRVGVDLNRVLRNPRDPENISLVDGDSIVISPRVQLVNVDGEVNAPTSVPYVPGESVDYYVLAAGGRGSRADLGRVYVTQPNGKVQGVRRRRFYPDDVPKPLPGSRVYVPARAAGTPEGNAIQTIATVAQILATLGGVIFTAIAISR